MLAVSVLLSSVTAAHAGTLDEIRERGTIRLGYSETSAPFAFKASAGAEPAGYSVELCTRVASEVQRSLGLAALKLEWVPLDPSTRVQAVVKQRVDMECGTTTVTLSRRREVDFSLPIFVDSSTVLGRMSAGRTLSDLSGKRIAVAASSTTEQALRRTLSTRQVSADVVTTRTLAEAFDLLKAARVDAIGGDRTALVGMFLSQRETQASAPSANALADGLVLFEESLSYEPYALMLRRGDPDFRLLVDTVLSDLYRSGEIHAVVRSWFSDQGKLSPAVLDMFELNALPK